MKSKNLILLFFIAILLLVFWLLQRTATSSFTDSEKAYRNTSHLILTKHVKCRMECRHITQHEIEEIISRGDVNVAKSGKGSKGDDTFALEGYSDEQQHIRVVVSPENDGLVVITCIDLGKEWPCNCY